MDQFDQRGRKIPDTNEDTNDEAEKINTANLYGSTPAPVPTEREDAKDVEAAEELTADDVDHRQVKSEDDSGSQVNSAVGWIALVLSIVSFFYIPIILGGAGIIVGFIAKSRNADTLGNTAIIAGAASIIITLFVLPYL